MQKILFIEDEEHFAEIVSTILRGQGFEVVLARDGEEGLRLVRELLPHLILLDLILPKVDGFDFLRRLRGSGDIPWIPVVVLTVQASERAIEEAKKLGCQDYLLKTEIDAHTLKDKIVAFIGTA